MAYYIDLFSPDTYEAFRKSDMTISGFRERHRGIASEIKPGDKFICYITKISRWIGVLQVESSYFQDDKPRFYTVNDPFIIRFKVKTKAWLPLDQSIPVWEDICWDNLSFTKKLHKHSLEWTGMVRGSLRKLNDTDGEFLENLIIKQLSTPTLFQLNEIDIKKLRPPVVKTQDSKQVQVSIPVDDVINKPSKTQEASIRTSVRIQALLAEIGEKMNFRIWIPRSDRQRVLELWGNITGCLLEILPLNYDDATLKTIENIDVLWIKGRSVIRAFEVEHTTSVYSGILRMADLMALQPNLNIRAHIIAPLDRKAKVLQEISRPVFAFLENGPLSESCSYISYDSILELSNEKQLKHMSDSVLEEYSEYSEESTV